MRESLEQCVVNCLNTEVGSYPLFRGFGINATDQNARLKRSQIQSQLSKFYPDINDLKVVQKDEDTYSISITGNTVEGRK